MYTLSAVLPGIKESWALNMNCTRFSQSLVEPNTSKQCQWAAPVTLCSRESLEMNFEAGLVTPGLISPWWLSDLGLAWLPSYKGSWCDICPSSSFTLANKSGWSVWWAAINTKLDPYPCSLYVWMYVWPRVNEWSYQNPWLHAVQDMSPWSSVLGIELHLHRVYTIDINVQQLEPVQSSESR